MKRSRFSRSSPSKYAHEYEHVHDSQNPRLADADWFKKELSSSRQRRQEHKTRQLCRQAYRSLTLALAEFAHDPLLADLVIQAVEPAPDVARLLVFVYSTAPLTDAAALYQRLAEVTGRLRGELASAITRKRAPELSFCVLPSPSAFGSEQEGK